MQGDAAEGELSFAFAVDENTSRLDHVAEVSLKSGISAIYLAPRLLDAVTAAQIYAIHDIFFIY